MTPATRREHAVKHIALIGNFLPRKCGLATFTTDTYNALRGAFPDLRVDVYAMDDHPGRYAYPPQVIGAIAQDDPGAYRAAARAIEASGAQALWLQHEYGIFGGSAGEHILSLLDRIPCRWSSRSTRCLNSPMRTSAG